jgi:pyridoxamine 5'-phosphate oxidase
MIPWRERLRGLQVFGADLPTFDVGTAPSTPFELFEKWLTEAIDARVVQPHSMTLATAGPQARTLILKDVDARGFWFASSDDSPKGRALAADRHAALLFYWRELGRQVRIEGVAVRGTPEQNAADFLDRSPSARAGVFAGHQSAPVDRVELDLEAARARADAGDVAEEWVAWCVEPRSVEFWQAEASRDHTRLRYEHRANGWERHVLVP